MNSAVAVKGLTHSYGGLRVLQDVDIHVAPGEFVAIVGPSGCGKSTVLRTLADLVQPDDGVVQVESVAYLPQKDLLLPWRRALGNAVVGADVAGEDRTESRTRATELFKRFGLSGFENAWPHQLSGGMRQRVAVLRTFLIPHPTLLLDEPFGALDALTRRSMQQWLEEVWIADQRSTILVTHDVEEALLLADRVLVMSSRPGRIVLDLEIQFLRQRTNDLTISPEFVDLKRQVLAALEYQP